MAEEDRPKKRPRMSLSSSPGQRAALDLLTAEWGNLLNDYVSAGTQNLRANNEGSAINTRNTTVQSEGPQFTHDSQTHVSNDSTIAWHLTFPEKADRTSQYPTDAEFAIRLNSYLLRESFRPTTGKDGITYNRTGGIIHGALASDGSTGHQAGSVLMPGNSQESEFSPNDQLPRMQTPTYDPLQAQSRNFQEPRHGLLLSAEFMAQVTQLQLRFEHEASIVSEQLAGMAQRFEGMQVLFNDELARIRQLHAEKEDELRRALEESRRR